MYVFNIFSFIIFARSLAKAIGLCEKLKTYENNMDYFAGIHFLDLTEKEKNSSIVLSREENVTSVTIAKLSNAEFELGRKIHSSKYAVISLLPEINKLPDSLNKSNLSFIKVSEDRQGLKLKDAKDVAIDLLKRWITYRYLLTGEGGFLNVLYSSNVADFEGFNKGDFYQGPIPQFTHITSEDILEFNEDRYPKTYRYRRANTYPNVEDQPIGRSIESKIRNNERIYNLPVELIKIK